MSSGSILTQEFWANSAIFQSSILAYNLLVWMMWLNNEDGFNEEPNTIRMCLINVPARLMTGSRSSGSLHLRMQTSRKCTVASPCRTGATVTRVNRRSMTSSRSRSAASRGIAPRAARAPASSAGSPARAAWPSRSRTSSSLSAKRTGSVSSYWLLVNGEHRSLRARRSLTPVEIGSVSLSEVQLQSPITINQ